MKSFGHLRALRYFERVAAHNHVGKAAMDLGVTPGAVSKIIHQLEERLGVKLIKKQGTGIQITGEGKQLAQDISGPFADIDKAVQ